MKQFIRENWFKILLLLAIIGYGLIWSFGEYRKAKEYEMNTFRRAELSCEKEKNKQRCI